MMLENKVAVIYGAGGAIGGAVARAFAHEGAKLFLTGRHRGPVETIAKGIVSAGRIRRGDGGRRSRRAGCGQASTVRDR
jgi:NADP-dependent 3-hydroxy acid dehydrogenase YdfG